MTSRSVLPAIPHRPILTSRSPQNHAKPTSHPPELVLNHFSTPLGLSLATLLSSLFLPPSTADVLSSQGYAGRQVVLAQNSRDFVFLRRYRYMFALKSHALGSKKKVGLERQGPAEEADEVIKARFQEIGPRMTVKMRWIRRGALGETGDERNAREKVEKAEGLEMELPVEGGEDEEGDIDMAETGGKDEQGGEGEEDEEKEAAKAIGLDEQDPDGQPTFDFNAAAASAEASRGPEPSTSSIAPSKRVKGPRLVPRKRKLPYHALLRPPPSPSPPPGYVEESAPAPLPSKDGKNKEKSILSTVGKTWHAGRGEGGVRESAKRREWGWEVSPILLVNGDNTDVRMCRRGCKSAEGSSSFREGVPRRVDGLVCGLAGMERVLVHCHLHPSPPPIPNHQTLSPALSVVQSSKTPNSQSVYQPTSLSLASMILALVYNSTPLLTVYSCPPECH